MLPPTIFTKAYNEDFRSMFRIELRDAFKGLELAKRNANIVKIIIYYVVKHRNKSNLQSYDDIYQFIKCSDRLTRRKNPSEFNQLLRRIQNANITISKKNPVQQKLYPGLNCI